MIYELNEINIDAASEQIADFLIGSGVDSKETTRIRLSAETALIKYLPALGGKKFEVNTAKRFKTLRVEISVSGESADPFSDSEDDEAALMHSLLSGFGLAPVWRYKNGKNIITFTAKKKRKISQLSQLGIAIALAVILGFLCNLLPQAASSFITDSLLTPVFDTFMGMLSAISGPIIFLSVVRGICGIGDMATFGKIGKKMISRFLIISLMVGVLGVAVCLPMFGMTSSGSASFAFSDLFNMVLDIIPDNMLTPFTEGNSLQIIFLAIVIGLALLISGNRVPVVTEFIEQVNTIIQYIMSAVSTFIPFFVFGSLFKMIVGGNFSHVLKSYKLVLAMLLGDLILMAAYLLIVSLSKKVSPTVLLSKLMPTFIIGLTTASSIAAFSTNVETCEKKLGIEKKIADIGIPLGQVVFMPGCIVLFLAAAFGMADFCGIAITPVWIITAFIISVVLAIAAPPVPGAALTCYTILFTQLDIPSDAVAVVIALNVILEFVTTAVNMFCLQTELTELSGSLKVLDLDMLRSRNNTKSKQ